MKDLFANIIIFKMIILNIIPNQKCMNIECNALQGVMKFHSIRRSTPLSYNHLIFNYEFKLCCLSG